MGLDLSKHQNIARMGYLYMLIKIPHAQVIRATMLVLVEGQFGQKMRTVLGESKVGFGPKTGAILPSVGAIMGTICSEKGVDQGRGLVSDSKSL